MPSAHGRLVLARIKIPWVHNDTARKQFCRKLPRGVHAGLLEHLDQQRRRSRATVAQ
jgi:hypothetical protein